LLSSDKYIEALFSDVENGEKLFSDFGKHVIYQGRQFHAKTQKRTQRHSCFSASLRETLCFKTKWAAPSKLKAAQSVFLQFAEAPYRMAARACTHSSCQFVSR